MDSTLPLQALSNLEHYRVLFCDPAYWQPYVRRVCQVHGLPCQTVTCGIAGTYPTFIVDRRWVVKFYGELFEGASGFELELQANQMLMLNPVLPTPRLLAWGELLPGEPGWRWPYLIFEFASGAHLVEVQDQLSPAGWSRLAGQIGELLRQLHALPLPAEGPLALSRAQYAANLQTLHQRCAAQQQEWGALPAPLIAQIETYLPPVAELTPPPAALHLVHFDLTSDHLLGAVQNGYFQLNALIDFGDARAGTLWNEIPALHLIVFRGDRRLLNECLAAYGFDRHSVPGGFARRALIQTLFHPYNPFAVVSEFLPLPTYSTLEQLAMDLF